MLDTAGSGSKEEAESTGRVIVGVIDWGYRSVMDIDKDIMSTPAR